MEMHFLAKTMAISPLRTSRSLETLTLIPRLSRRNPSSLPVSLISRLSSTTAGGIRRLPIASGTSPSMIQSGDLMIAGAEEALMGYITGKKKATQVAHSVWRSILRKGDTVVDATCGNGHDTLALLRIVADELGRGSVYGLDIQQSAIENTSSLLRESVDDHERKLVKLFLTCHGKMETVIPKGTSVRLIAFNLGYLPGGDKTIITTTKTTLPALQAASRVLESGGLISMVVYVGHPGGREELETVRSFASSLPIEYWVTSMFEILNRPTSPVLVLLFKK